MQSNQTHSRTPLLPVPGLIRAFRRVVSVLPAFETLNALLLGRWLIDIETLCLLFVRRPLPTLQEHTWQQQNTHARKENTLQSSLELRAPACAGGAVGLLNLNILSYKSSASDRMSSSCLPTTSPMLNSLPIFNDASAHSFLERQKARTILCAQEKAYRASSSYRTPTKVLRFFCAFKATWTTRFLWAMACRKVICWHKI